MKRHRKSNKIEVIERRLGREGCDGLAWLGENKIEIDPRQDSKEYMDTCIHESLHIIWEDIKESEIRIAAKRITDVLWRQGFRKIQD